MRASVVLVLGLMLVGCGRFEPRLSESLLQSDRVEVSETPEVAQSRDLLILLEKETLSLDAEALKLAEEMRFDFDRLKDLLKNFAAFSKQLRDRIDALQDAIHQQLARLDPQNPQHQRLIDRLTMALERLEEFEQRLSELEARLHSSIEDLIAKLRDRLRNMNPIARFVFERVLDRLEEKLKDLLPPVVI